MNMTQILSEIRTFDGLLELAPLPGSEHPTVSWGDHFFYYAPDGQVPRNRQPYATIVTKNYPDDEESRLDDEDRWRLNIHVGTNIFTDLLGHQPDEIDEAAVDYSVTDTFLPHPLYGTYGWVCIVNPADATTERALEALRIAHQDDQRRVERRQSRGDASQNG
ncbi:DUF6194 family protein [Agromyces laixinhei]|uniref:DUF6194 family protein n=1 Tax=Agromyces laixinhei TaxID=2585717 RepID=UPI0011169EFB|nr:DUF6194 family protein [Agromyces laixinhei]